MKKNSVRLICTSVASGETKNYAVLPVKVKDKKIEYTEEELKALAEGVLNPKTQAESYDVENEAVANDEPIVEAVADAEPIVEDEAPIEEAVADDEPIEEDEAPIEEAVANDEPVVEDEEPIEEAVADDEPAPVIPAPSAPCSLNTAAVEEPYVKRKRKIQHSPVSTPQISPKNQARPPDKSGGLTWKVLFISSSGSREQQWQQLRQTALQSQRSKSYCPYPALRHHPDCCQAG